MTRARARITLSLILTVVSLIATAAVAATPASAGTVFKLQDTYTDMCMIDPIFDAYGGAIPVLGTCALMRRRVRDTAGANEWTTVPSTQGVKIKNAYTGHCLEHADDTWPRASWEIVRVNPCTDSPRQNWFIQPQTLNYLAKLRTASANYCLSYVMRLLNCGDTGNIDTWLLM